MAFERGRKPKRRAGMPLVVWCAVLVIERGAEA
jgi:hypothetical protein